MNNLQSQRQHYDELGDKLAAQLKMAKTDQQRASLTQQEEAANDKYEEFDGKIANISKLYPLTKDVIAQRMKAASDAGVKISSIVISGHSNGSSFWGDATPRVTTTDADGNTSSLPSDIDPGDFKAVFGSSPATKSVRSLYLWGCYGQTTYGATSWKATFPSIEMFAGFNDPGPLDATASSPALLKDLLIKDQKIVQDRDDSALLKDYSQLTDVHFTHLAMLVNQCYTDGKETKSFQQLSECTDKLKKISGEMNGVYADYFNAKDAAYANPPSDPHNSPLRDFYNDMQQNRACVKSFTNFAAPSVDNILGLLFFKNVEKNFCAFYGDEFTAASQAVNDSTGVNWGSSCNPDWSRQQWLQFVAALSHVAVDQTPPASSALVKTYNHFLNGIYGLDCLPETWITDAPIAGSKPSSPAPSCIDNDQTSDD